MSTALTYLAGARGRPNLEIRANSLVDRVSIESRRAVAVVLASGESVAAGQVVLAAGAYSSPALLLRSAWDRPKTSASWASCQRKIYPGSAEA
jgi:choline dehydrogenase-like flavoprotein